MIFTRRFAKLTFPLLMFVYLVTIMEGLVAGANIVLNYDYLVPVVGLLGGQ